jgi:hypothetical protein
MVANAKPGGAVKKLGFPLTEEQIDSSTALLYELNAGDLEGDWMRSRARAEQLRSEYFDRLVARAAKNDSATQAAAFDLVKTPKSDYVHFMIENQ